MKFIDLFSLGKNLPPVEQQIFIGNFFGKEFASITENRMSLQKFDNNVSKTGVKFLLGVCPSWNLYDLYLLDCINDSLQKKSFDEVFEVVDLDDLSRSEIEKIFGDIKPNQPPILGIWKDGILQNSFGGWEAKNLLIEKFGFVWQPPKIWLNQS